jgi:asparagine synthase (glutamine-hydrolysing)
MCGIVGVWDFRNDLDLEALIPRMTETLRHRGPDDAGVYIDKSAGVALGHTRLSILDLSPAGHQPMANDIGDIWIVYNGEVYNFADLRTMLEATGAKFRSNSDTEVVLKAYETWGLASLTKFIGMFAFCIWDKRRRKLVLVRDRVGVKPLYYCLTDRYLLFGSELRALRVVPGFDRTLDVATLPAYLQFGYIPTPASIFRNTRKLAPGHYLEINAEGGCVDNVYWDLASVLQNSSQRARDSRAGSCERARSEELECLMADAFRDRLVSDVPVGVFLSGGIDSSLLTALLRRHTTSALKTFTMGIDNPQYDESGWARKVAHHLETDHYEFRCTASDTLNATLALPEVFDEPFADNSAVPTYLLAKWTRDVVKVALSADGGDELFGGYSNYTAVQWFARVSGCLPSFALRQIANLTTWLSVTFLERLENSEHLPVPLSVLLNRQRKFAEGISERSPERLFEISRSHWMPSEVQGLLGRKWTREATHVTQTAERFRSVRPGLLDRMMLTDIVTYLPDDILTKVDRATMAVGLEAREPFLDHRLIEYAIRLPIGQKIRGRKGKYIAREILAKYVPKALYERPKRGFSIPLYEWFRGDLADLYRVYLDPHRLSRGGIFDGPRVGQHLSAYLSGRSSCGMQLWLLLVFELWKERWG